MPDRKKPVQQLDLSVRARNALLRAGVFTVENLLEQNEESLTKIKNLGRKSIDEILTVIETLRSTEEENVSAPVFAPPEDFTAWLCTDEGRDAACAFLKETRRTILDLDLLSTRAYNLLSFGGIDGLEKVAFLNMEDLMEIPGMDRVSANEILSVCQRYLEDNQFALFGWLATQTEQFKQPILTKPRNLQELLAIPQCRKDLLEYIRENERYINEMPLSNRAKGRLTLSGLNRLSDIIFMSREQLLSLPSMGTRVAEEILNVMAGYLNEYGTRMLSLYRGDLDELWDDGEIRQKVLALYQDAPFRGFSLVEFTQSLRLPEEFPQQRLKQIIGSLLAEGVLEYVDYRCYMVYESFSGYLVRCPKLDQRLRDIVRGRLQGKTLEEIAQEYGLTRERVRQLSKKAIPVIRSEYYTETGLHQFDEDYFRYFYQTYAMEKKDAEQWFGLSAEVWNYLDLSDAGKGVKSLRSALEDTQNLDAGLRLKIKNYLNRNKLYIDGIWIEKKRSELEELVVRKYCVENTSFSRFVKLYNEFLAQEDIPYDESIYYTEGVLRTRKSHLAQSRYLLWKQNEQIRAYDIDGRDYTELLETLNLDSYENISLSTVKFWEMYPELMERYDIRDQYELHNLLRKIVPEGSYHDFHCGKMPEIRFGTFDRDSAILDILIDHAPISQTDLCHLIYREYGYDPAVIAANYLKPFSLYYHQGMYMVDQKQMSRQNYEALEARLNGDFYYIDEVRAIYSELFPNADMTEINPYNLKSMGFQVLSRYVLRNYPSLEVFFETILTKEDIIDIGALRSRYGSVQAYYATFLRLKTDLTVVEFEPGKLIQFRKLEQFGMSYEKVRDFCNSVWDQVEDSEYFSLQSIRKSGFESELFQWGFSDWFYSNLLITDSRFSYTQAFRSLIFVKGTGDVTIKSFLLERVRFHNIIDAYDLMNELTDEFGCIIKNKSDIIERVKGTQVYYDKILDRLYAHADLYYSELDEMGGAW